jgi:mRNA interferase MazF
MGAPAVGDVVLVPFPFSDLSGSKLRPAAVVSKAERGEVILCQITSRAYASKIAMPLADANFEEGGLQRTSFARYDKLFTTSPSIIVRTVGTLDWAATDELQGRVAGLFSS